MRKKHTLLIVLLAVAILASASTVQAGDWFSKMFGRKGIRGSGDRITQERDLPEFTRIENLGPFDVFVESGPRQQVRITFDDNLIDLIETEVRGKTLKIYCDESYRADRGCKVEITVAELDRITMRGSGDITAEGLTNRRFKCETRGSGDITLNSLTSKSVRCSISGSGDIEISNLKADYLECRISGSGNLDAAGAVEDVDISVSGSGDVNTRGLTARTASVLVRGSGDVRVYAEDSFEGAVYGSGDVSVYGRPEHISRHVTGSGSIRRR
jgi:DUF4097 and DUF4098 domain-containing protein YvlB